MLKVPLFTTFALSVPDPSMSSSSFAELTVTGADTVRAAERYQAAGRQVAAGQVGANRSVVQGKGICRDRAVDDAAAVVHDDRPQSDRIC